MFARSLLRRCASLPISCNAVTKLLKSSALTNRSVTVVRPITCSACRYQEEEDENKTSGKQFTTDPKREGCKGYKPRSVKVQDSIRYMDSDAYYAVYKDEPVWKPYRRNRKGSLYCRPRKSCIRLGIIANSSPCPICRDDYLVLDYRNVKLLKQFVSDTTGEPKSPEMTGICMAQMKKLQYEVAKAQEYGYLEKHLPIRRYNYEYFENLAQNIKKEEERSKVVETPES